MKKHSVSLLIALMLISSSAFAGKQSGGGGTIFYRTSSNPLLLDLLNIDSQFSDTTSFFDAALASGSISASKLFEEVGPIVIDSEEKQAAIRSKISSFNLVYATLNRWNNTIPNSVGNRLFVGLELPLRWHFVDESEISQNIYLPNTVVQNYSAQIRQAAKYERSADLKGYNVKVFIGPWNQLGLFSQSGLIIHEAVRQIQIGWNRVFNDEALQKITAIVLLCEPNSKLDKYIIDLMDTREILASRKLLLNFESIVKQNCKRIR